MVVLHLVNGLYIVNNELGTRCLLMFYSMLLSLSHSTAIQNYEDNARSAKRPQSSGKLSAAVIKTDINSSWLSRESSLGKAHNAIQPWCCSFCDNGNRRMESITAPT